MSHYREAHRINDRLVRLQTQVTRRGGDVDWDHTIWTAGVIRGRAKACGICGTPICVGETAFSPLTNKSYRGDRLHGECIDGL